MASSGVCGMAATLITTGVRFAISDHRVEAVVLPYDALKRPPSSPIDGKPMRRASIRQVEELIEENSDADQKDAVPQGRPA